ncbi:hypothetical protein [Halorussus pelagicus]|uniref:hypothetical protein n=1 Tax=Halorussus pelagicus TaxID=2505977 RepID=UPI000FFCBB15|nr:hypothetical protein [Halorussus pelagicus]
MSSPFASPLIRYGMGLSSAAILTFIALTFLDGITRWVVLGLAVFEIVFVPQLLKRVVAEQNA